MNNFDPDDSEFLDENEKVTITNLNLFNTKHLSASHTKKLDVFHTQKMLLRVPLLFQHRKIRSTVFLTLLLIGIIIFVDVSNIISLTVKKFDTTSYQSPSPNSIEPNKLANITSASWSPDNSQIAVVGYSQNCTFGYYCPNLINIYEVRTSKRLLQIHPDVSIITEIKKHYPKLQQPSAISYTHLLWSPDGSRLALSFLISFPKSSAITNMLGVLLHNKERNEKLLVTSWPKSENNYSRSYVVWDLEKGVLLQGEKYTLPSTPPVEFNILPAQAYQWNNSGLLVPNKKQSITHPSSNQVHPIGNPSGDSSFTVWQPGKVVELPRSQNKDNIYAWQTWFAAWSSNGRYFTDITTGGRLQLQSQQFSSQKDSHNSWFNQVPVIDMHDGAFEMLVRSGVQRLALHQQVRFAVAWRPDGHLIASFDENRQLNVYSCINAHRLISLNMYNAVPEGENTLVWSPNGLYLLLFSSSRNNLYIWKTDKLPYMQRIM